MHYRPGQRLPFKAFKGLSCFPYRLDDWLNERPSIPQMKLNISAVCDLHHLDMFGPC